MGAENEETLTPAVKDKLLSELLELRRSYPKIYLPELVVEGYRQPPALPDDCIFARTTLNYNG